MAEVAAGGERRVIAAQRNASASPTANPVGGHRYADPGQHNPGVVAAVLAVALVWPAGAGAARYGSRTLAPGARGGDVKQLQRYLARAGHRTRADGAFGRRTARALQATERELELRADGIATPPEQQVIRRAVARPGGSPSSVTSQSAEVVPGAASMVSADGFAVAPAAAPQAVKDVVAAANQIAKTPYKWGGGHGRWGDSGFDCSGSVSYALHGGGLLDSPLVSGAFARWGASGPGSWITIYANRAHVFMVVAGSRFDTSARSRTGSRWTSTPRSPAGYTASHPVGL